MSTSILSKNLIINGDITSSGELVLNGTVNGDMKCAKLTIDKDGAINGDVVGEDVTISGKIEGSVQGRQVSLRKSAQITGEIIHNSMSIEQGTVYSGRLRCDKSL